MKIIKTLIKTSLCNKCPSVITRHLPRKLTTLATCATKPWFTRLSWTNNYIYFNCFDSTDTSKYCVGIRTTTTQTLPIIYLFTKEGCTLCDVAKDNLKPHMHRFILKEVDITLPENDHWYQLYKYEIPVFHIYEEFLFKHRVDINALERGLEKYKHGYPTNKK